MTAEGAEKILNQEEVDALINGIDAGAVAVTDRIRYRRRAAEAAEHVAA